MFPFVSTYTKVLSRSRCFEQILWILSLLNCQSDTYIALCVQFIETGSNTARYIYTVQPTIHCQQKGCFHFMPFLLDIFTLCTYCTVFTWYLLRWLVFYFIMRLSFQSYYFFSKSATRQEKRVGTNRLGTAWLVFDRLEEGSLACLGIYIYVLYAKMGVKTR